MAHRPKIKHHPANIAPASYAPATQTLRLKNPTIDPQTLRHELGHHIDNIHAADGILWSQIHLDKSIRKDLQWWTNRQKTALVEILREEEYRKLVEVIEAAEEVYADAEPKHRNIVYVFDDPKDETKVNKIIINLNHTIKKFGKTNAVVTLDKGKKSEVEKRKKSGVYIRAK